MNAVTEPRPIILRERAIAYRLFATLLSREVTPADAAAVELLHDVYLAARVPDPGAGIRDVARALGTMINTLPEDDAGEEYSLLAAEFAALFLGSDGPPEASPHQSTYREAAPMPDNTLSEVRTYLEAFHLRAGLPCGPEDHIAVELSLMAELIEREPYLRQGEFLTGRLLPWVPCFSRSVCAHARLGFYPAVVAAIEIFLKADQTFLAAF